MTSEKSRQFCYGLTMFRKKRSCKNMDTKINIFLFIFVRTKKLNFFSQALKLHLKDKNDTSPVHLLKF